MFSNGNGVTQIRGAANSLNLRSYLGWSSQNNNGQSFQKVQDIQKHMIICCETQKNWQQLANGMQNGIKTENSGLLPSRMYNLLKVPQIQQQIGMKFTSLQI